MSGFARVRYVHFPSFLSSERPPLQREKGKWQYLTLSARRRNYTAGSLESLTLSILMMIAAACSPADEPVSGPWPHVDAGVGASQGGVRSSMAAATPKLESDGGTRAGEPVRDGSLARMKKASSPPEADAEPEDGKSGAGGEPCCLETKPLVKEGEEVIPQTMLHLKGDQMGSCGAPIVAYSWTVKQPAGSNQVFVPASHFPNPTFTTNSAGEYEFCLSGVDAKGNKSCTSTCIKILVLPEEAIHVELDRKSVV